MVSTESRNLHNVYMDPVEAHSIANLLTWRHGPGVLVLTFRKVEVSREVRLVSPGRAKVLQLENGCSERPNPLGFNWDFAHTGCTHMPTSHILSPVYRHTHKSLWQTPESRKLELNGNYDIIQRYSHHVKGYDFGSAITIKKFYGRRNRNSQKNVDV